MEYTLTATVPRRLSRSTKTYGALHIVSRVHIYVNACCACVILHTAVFMQRPCVLDRAPLDETSSVRW